MKNPELSPTDLLARRELLRLRSAQLREQIAQGSQVFSPAFRTADRVRGGMNLAGQIQKPPPVLLLGLSALLGAVLVRRPRAVLSMGTRLWSGWLFYKRARPMVRNIWRQLQ